MAEILAIEASLTGYVVHHIKGEERASMIAPTLARAYGIAGQWMRKEWFRPEGNC